MGYCSITIDLLFFIVFLNIFGIPQVKKIMLLNAHKIKRKDTKRETEELVFKIL